MSAAARELLSAFEALPETDRDTLFQEILLRSKPGSPRLTDEALCEIADELFQMYDAAEASDAAAAD